MKIEGKVPADVAVALAALADEKSAYRNLEFTCEVCGGQAVLYRSNLPHWRHYVGHPV